MTRKEAIETLGFQLGISTEEAEKYFDYLDALRLSGKVNMFGAGSYIENEFGVSRNDARSILKMWMDSFGK